MGMEGVLKQRNGKLYVLHTYDEYSEPYRQFIWFLVLESRGTGYGERPEAGDIATSTGGGQWRTRNGSHRSTGSVSIGTGSTPAETVERVGVPPPAAGGKELRWNDGRWEKLTAKGWVPAGEGKPKKGPKTAGMRMRGGGDKPATSRRTRTRSHLTASSLQIGDIVQRADVNSRNRYVITEIRSPWIFTRRISGSGGPGTIQFPSSAMLKKAI